MAFFPVTKMPKTIRREGQTEVDNSPSIFNARDYNIHHRELLAIEDYLVGNGISSNSGIYNKLVQIITDFRNLTHNGLITQHCGTIKSGDRVPVPSNLATTVTDGSALSTGTTTITVASTAGFPSKGLITKFNAITAATTGSPEFKNYSFGASVSNHEIIRYTGKTDTTFTGCTRAVGGTAQAVASGATAQILAGKASLFLTHLGWQGSTGPAQFYIEHDAILTTTAALYGFDSTLTNVDTVIEVAYAMTIVGSHLI